MHQFWFIELDFNANLLGRQFSLISYEISETLLLLVDRQCRPSSIPHCVILSQEGRFSFWAVKLSRHDFSEC